MEIIRIINKLLNSLCFLFILIFLCHDRGIFAQDATPPSTSSSPFSQNGFLPEIALIMDFSYLTRDCDDRHWLATLNPVSLSDDSTLSIRGFHLNYVEMSFSSAVDPFFSLTATLSYSGDGVEIEEAMATLNKLPIGLQLNAGKLKSDFGHINQQHEHFWNFSQAPLVIRNFFADGLNELGLRLSWVAPVPFYLQIAIEALQGQNDTFFGATVTPQTHDSSLPALWIGTAKASFDIGQMTALMGISVARGSRHGAAVEGQPGFWSDPTYLLGSDILVKYLIDSYRYLALQGEYLYRTNTGAPGQDRSGYYLEGVWKWDSRLRGGLRYDLFDLNALDRVTYTGAMWQITAMLELSPSEFSRLRLEYRYNHSRFDGAQPFPCSELELSLNVLIGAHGAHSF
jgi:outer membrane receptor protein involved in Fe transport